jgi:hypothetical protein
VARLFNAYVIVHWSAASKPATGPDSVWIGVLKRDVRFRFVFEAHNPSTRAEAEALITQIIEDRAKRRERTLLALQFPFGFPHGLSGALEWPGAPPWRAVWDQIAKMAKDKADNTNNRFGVGSEINRRLTGGPFPFWGCPPRDALTTLQPKRTRAHGKGDLPENRIVDARAKDQGSIWKLYYNGSIGGHAILGIPMLRRLKSAFDARLAVWPFETGLKALTENDLADVDILAVEMGPSPAGAAALAGEAKDAAELRAIAEALAKLDETGALAAALAAPKDLSPEETAIAESEEGWTLRV